MQSLVCAAIGTMGEGSSMVEKAKQFSANGAKTAIDFCSTQGTDPDIEQLTTKFKSDGFDGKTAYQFIDIQSSCSESEYPISEENKDLLGSQYIYHRRQVSSVIETDLTQMAYADIVAGDEPLKGMSCQNLPNTNLYRKCLDLKGCNNRQSLLDGIKDRISSSTEEIAILGKILREKRSQYEKIRAVAARQVTNADVAKRFRSQCR